MRKTAVLKPLVIVKVGGSLLTDRSKSTPTPQVDQIRRIGSELVSIFDSDFSLILVHGAGSYGHPQVAASGLDKGLTQDSQLLQAARLQVLQCELDTLVARHWIDGGLACFPLQPSASAIMKGGRLQSLNTEVIESLLKSGLVPLLYGVPAVDRDQGISILSGDEIAPFLARHLEADLVIHLTQVGGVYSGDPRREEEVEKWEEISPENWEKVRLGLAPSASVDVTGGMLGKVEKSYQLAQEGIPLLIARPGELKEALKGRGGTRILGPQKKFPSLL